MDKYVIDGYRLENKKFTESELDISLRSKLLYSRNKMEFNEFHTNILNELKTSGIAICHINDFNDTNIIEKFANLKEYYQKFKNHPVIRSRMNDYQTGKSIGGNKEFEINSRHYLGRDLDLGDNVIEFFLSDIFLNLASSYFTKCPKAFQFNSWIHMSSVNKNSRLSSMNWHRDPEAIRIFKIFLVVEDIGIDNGPFQYIKCSHVDGKYSDLQEYKISGRYPDDTLIDNKVNEEDIISLAGTAGTIAFVDTFGFHRGGYVESDIRCLAQGVFLKPEVVNLPIWKDQRINVNINHTTYGNLSEMSKYAINNEF
jgi:hypothetical protein